MLRPKVKDIEKLKNEISATLRGQPKRILVMIDDIDRLTSEEIRQVFRAVKSVGDFPNVTYLLAVPDKQVVARSLGDLQGGSARMTSRKSSKSLLNCRLWIVCPFERSFSNSST